MQERDTMGGNTLPNAPDVLAGVASIILTELADHPDRNVWVTETDPSDILVKTTYIGNFRPYWLPVT